MGMVTVGSTTAALLLAAAAVAVAESDTLIVTTQQGTLRCMQATARTRACLGVPYARPPLGNLRWRPPQPPAHYAATPRDATQPAAQCLQANSTGRGFSEDCLTVSVYYPSAAPPPGGWPVVAWIHGGGYSTGRGPNGTGFVDYAGGVVWFSIEYRLNVYGFLGSHLLRIRSLDGSTGNYGLQDQRAALQWIRENAQSFGGNPNSITIDGCSAGAGSTTNHMVNPRSWPFFDRAAAESGAMAQWNVNTLPQAEALFGALAVATSCADVDCLVALPAAELSAAALQAAASDTGPFANNALPWAPVVDGVDVLGTPEALAAKGQLFKGPVLLGTARQEVCSLERSDFPGNFSRNDFLVDCVAEYSAYGANASRLAELYEGHAATRDPDGTHSEWWWAAILRGSDFGFHCPTRRAARLFHAHGNDVFLYSYNRTNPALGCVNHCSELSGITLQGPPDPSTPDGRLFGAMSVYWANFARHGDPNGATGEGQVPWPAYTPSADQLLVFAPEKSGGIRTEAGYRSETCEYWDGLSGHPD